MSPNNLVLFIDQPSPFISLFWRWLVFCVFLTWGDWHDDAGNFPSVFCCCLDSYSRVRFVNTDTDGVHAFEGL